MQHILYFFSTLKRPVRLVGLLISLWIIGLSVAQAQTITGTVFRDYNSDGIKQATEPVIAGVVVKAYNASETQCSSTTTTSTTITGGKNYSLTGCTGPVRVEFTIPSEVANVCGLSDQLDFTAYSGGAYGSSVQFTTGGSSINFAVGNPHQYASSTLVNPKIFTSCYVSGNNSGTGNVGNADAFIGVDYNPTGNTTPAPGHYANARQIGSTWGVAYSKQAKRIFTSAVLKRHTGLGPLGSGGIYMINPAIQLPALTGVTNFLNFDAIGIPTSATGTYAGQSVAGPSVAYSPVIGTNAERGLGLNVNTGERDAQALAQAGRVSFGDMDISDDGRYLYVMNLYDRRLYEIDLTDPNNPVAPTAANRATKIRSWAIPEPCVSAEGVARPWGIDFYRGKPYIGVVCNAVTSQLKSDLDFTIYQLDPTTGTFTAQFTSALNFPRGLVNGFGDASGVRKGWFAWTDNWNQMIAGTTNPTWPQPILSDIEFDTDGSMILGFIDRTGLQGGWANLGPITGVTTLYRTIVGGDLLRAYKRPDCAWELESAGKEGPSSPKPATGGATNGEGPGNGEFYYEEFFASQHRETALGGLGVLFGSGDVVTTLYDPFRYDSFGIGWFDNTTGKKDKGFEVFETGFNGNGGTFSKGLSLGDIEIQNELPPLEIGNRIWKDTNEDGIQNADEVPIVGVVVELVNASGTIVGTATTNASGTWYFNQTNVVDTLGANKPNVLGLQPTTNYTVRVAASQFNNTGSGPLAGLALTIPNAGNTAINGDLRDSDAFLVSGLASISLTTGEFGQNDHTFDMGFSEPTQMASLGDYVFSDNNKDGIQNGSDTPLPGVVVTLFQNGSAVATTTTNGAGAYSFTGLTPGTSNSYVVEFTKPTGYTTSPANAPGSTTANDSDADLVTGRTQSVTLAPGENNPTLDAGFYLKPASLGDYVFSDNNKDGIQNAGDTPLPGVVVTLFQNGSAVATTTTNGAGAYSFTGLTPGTSNSYVVGFTKPTGYTTSPANAPGSTTANDSDADVVTGRTQSVTLAPGENNPTLDAGFFPIPPALGDYAFIDNNANGIQDAGDAPLPGVVVTLFQNGSAVATTTTNAGGLYIFKDLIPGVGYEVSFTPPMGYTTTQPNAPGSTTATDSDVNLITGRTQSVTLVPGEINTSLDGGFVPPAASYALTKTVDQRKVEKGQLVTYTVSLTNTAISPATNLTLTDQFSSSAVTLVGSATASVGTFVPGINGGTWTIPALAGGQVATLTFSAQLNEEGITYNTITLPGQQTATACTSVPFKVCANTPFEFLLSAPASLSAYQWSRNGTPIVGATSATLSVTQIGEYTVSANGAGGCPNGTCCPFIIEETPAPSLTAVAQSASCVGVTPQANAAITLVGSSTNAVSYNITQGASFTAGTPLFGSPQALSAVAVGGTLLGGQPNPAVATIYTIRVYGADGCFSDSQVTILPTVCACPPPRCVPIRVRRRTL